MCGEQESIHLHNSIYDENISKINETSHTDAILIIYGNVIFFYESFFSI